MNRRAAQIISDSVTHLDPESRDRLCLLLIYANRLGAQKLRNSIPRTSVKFASAFRTRRNTRAHNAYRQTLDTPLARQSPRWHRRRPVALGEIMVPCARPDSQTIIFSGSALPSLPQQRPLYGRRRASQPRWPRRVEAAPPRLGGFIKTPTLPSDLAFSCLRANS